MSLASDFRILYHMALSPIRGGSHADRLESFYGGQAKAYDAFRERLLKGRRELCAALELPADGRLVDMGGGTGANIEFLDDRVHELSKVYVVDLCGSLLDVARERFEANGWPHVQAVEADATQWQPDEPVDAVTFSYSLTMIPDWFAAIDNALRMLKPGGTIGVVDFYVSRKYPAQNATRHPWRTRAFWPLWFASDNVFPNPDHLPYLQHRFATVSLIEQRGKVPYLPFGRVPYYSFIGKKTDEGNEV